MSSEKMPDLQHDEYLREVLAAVDTGENGTVAALELVMFLYCVLLQ